MRTTLREWTVFGVSIFASLVLLASNQEPQIQVMRAAALSTFGTLQKFLQATKQWFSMSGQIDRLMEQNARLLLETARFRDAAMENARLRALLGFRERSKFDVVPAEVIAVSTSGAIHSVKIDAGAEDGIERDSPVVTADGLVGRVFLVGPRYSVVHVLLDRNFRAAALIERNRVHGIVRWSGGEYCLLDGVPAREDVRVGDVVVTSGLGGIYPRGIRIGVVTQVAEDVTSIFKTITVKPFVDFSRLEEVAVLRHSTGPGREPE